MCVQRECVRIKNTVHVAVSEIFMVVLKILSDQSAICKKF